MKGRQRRRPFRFLVRFNGREAVPQIAVRQKEIRLAFGIRVSIILQYALDGFHGGAERMGDDAADAPDDLRQAVSGFRKNPLSAIAVLERGDNEGGVDSEDFVGMIGLWRHSGFHAFAGDEIPDIGPLPSIIFHLIPSQFRHVNSASASPG